MKKQIIGGLFALIAMFFTVVSCRKDAQTVTAEPTQTQFKVDAVKGDFHVENGILHFDSQQTFYDVCDKLRKFDVSERKHFGKTFGFKSLLSAYMDLQRQSELTEDEQTHKANLENNTDIIDASANDGTFEMRIINKELAPLLNRDGFVFIDKVAYRFTEFGEAMALDGDFNRLRDVSKITKSDKNIKVFVANKLELRAPCGVGQTKTTSNSSDNRRGELTFSRVSEEFFAGFDSNNNPVFNVVNTSFVVGTPFKRTIFGGFRNYTTVNELTINQSLRTYSNSCTYGDNTFESNEDTGIFFSGASCVLFNIPEANVSNNYATYVSANTTYVTRGGVNNNITCQ
jgi:hypothetical protein